MTRRDRPVYPVSPPPLTIIVNGKRITARPREADDASKARALADSVSYAMDVAIGVTRASNEGRNPFAILALGTAEQVAELHRIANGQPVPHCRHGQHFARHTHTARAR